MANGIVYFSVSLVREYTVAFLSCNFKFVPLKSETPTRIPRSMKPRDLETLEISLGIFLGGRRPNVNGADRALRVSSVCVPCLITRCLFKQASNILHE